MTSLSGWRGFVKGIIPNHFHGRFNAASALRVMLRLACLAVLTMASSLAADSPGRISGRVTDPQGAVVSSAQVKVADQAGATVCATKTDAQGYFVCGWVGTGQFTVIAEGPEFAPVSASIRMASEAAVEVNLQFPGLSSQKKAVTVVAASRPSALSPDPAERIVVHDQVLDANPGRPRAPI